MFINLGDWKNTVRILTKIQKKYIYVYMNPYIYVCLHIHIYEPIRAEEYRTEVESTLEGINSRQDDVEE